jgi:AI-2 transport protein TqsA
MASVPKPVAKPRAADAGSGPEKLQRTKDSLTMRNAVVVIAVVIAGAALKWLSGILTPLALAIFLLVMIDLLARNLKARVPFLPAWAPLPLAVVVSVLLFVGTALLVADNAAGFKDQLIGYGPRLNSLIATVADKLNIAAPPSINQLFARLNPASYVGSVFSGLQSFASNAVFVLIYLGFLIASRRGFASKSASLFPAREERAEALFVFHRIRDGVEQYLWIQTVLGLGIAVFSWGVMALVGLDNAFFWAFLIFVAGYIPIIGGAVGVLVPPIFALVQFTELWPAAVLFAVLNIINFFAANVLQPRMQGASLNLDPVVVLLSLAFWGALWGVAGMFLSTPLTVMTMVILAQFQGTRWIAVLLSGDGHPEAAAQRKKKLNSSAPLPEA